MRTDHRCARRRRSQEGRLYGLLRGIKTPREPARTDRKGILPKPTASHLCCGKPIEILVSLTSATCAATFSPVSKRSIMNLTANHPPRRLKAKPRPCRACSRVMWPGLYSNVWIYFWEWTTNQRFTPEFRAEFGSMLAQLSMGWDSILDGDINNIADDVRVNLCARYSFRRPMTDKPAARSPC